ncbi:MAG TPA: lipopolysaccharide heptosyltransferase II [Candidatus Deferrimicrobium sp.]|nr:lipopolysaccharide heptosyltransferase II [Candidatus Deferrimicrobium sp.]
MPLKILIRAPNHLGDCIMALPMINETREAYPGAAVTLLAPDYLAQLFERNPGIDETIGLPAGHLHGLIAVMKIRELIARRHFDIGYILPPSFGAAAAFKLGGVKDRIGYVSDGRRLLLSRPMVLPTPLNTEHRSMLYFNLLRRASGKSLEFGRPKLFLDDSDVRAGDEALAPFCIGRQEPYAVVAFRAVAESRRWGTDNYIALVKAIVSGYRLKVVLIGGAQDQREGETISSSAGTKEVCNLAGKTSLRQTAVILSLGRFFVGNDSGPAHLAAAVGTPLVVLSGADDPGATSPLAAVKRLVRLDHLDCISCEKNRCPLGGDRRMQCMKGITVPMVIEEIENLLRPRD